jgi:predicted Fe-Mo cluster-binding NifX family protein
MLGVTGMPQPSGEAQVKPVEFLPNLKVMSMESLLQDKDAAAIWRGPVKIGVIRQFISDVDWGNLDYLIIDSPPGTGDEPLTVAQTVNGAKAVVVTTPQEISLADVRKSINFCRQVNMEIIGVVENMSGLACPHCGKTFDLFKQGGGRETALNMGVRFLGDLPVEPRIVEEADRGGTSVLDDSSVTYTKKLAEIIDQIVALSAQAQEEKAQQDESDTNVKGVQTMNGDLLFAIPTAQGELCNHFGHCEKFALVTVKDGKVVNQEMLTPPPHEPGVLPKWLAEKGANIIIAGGMGKRAQDLFTEQGIKVVTGAPVAAPDQLVSHYLGSTLVTGANTCDH